MTKITARWGRLLGQGDVQHVHHLASESSPQWPPKHNNFTRRFYFSNYKQHTQTVSISQSNTPSGSSATPSKPPPSGCNPIIGFYDYQLTHQLNENTSLLKRSASNLAESNLVVNTQEQTQYAIRGDKVYFSSI